MLNYPIAIVKDDDAGNYGAVIPDVPSCIAMGDTIDDTIMEAQSLLRAHIECTLDENLPFDFKVSSIEDLKKDPEYDEVVTWALVAIDETTLSKQKRFNVSWPQYMLDRVDAHIAGTHDTRSGFLAKAVQQAINQPVNR